MAVETGYTKQITDKIKTEIHKAVIKQDTLSDMALNALLSGGHILIEGMPGLAKTLWARVFSKTIDTQFKRVQFTADLMPSDILGTKVFDMKSSEFVLKKGPLFTNIFLADEINRTPPKTQSALLEVMEERTITIDGQPQKLSEPFLVIATQNPIEFEGTYPLPEALVDRFMMKLTLTYPGVAAEKQMLRMYDGGFSASELDGAQIQAVCTAGEFLLCREEIKAVRVDDSIFNYIVSIVETTRRINSVSIGASPRGAIALLLNSKTYAAMNGRDFVIPDDVKELATPVLRHRIILKPEAEIEGVQTDAIVESILSTVKVPR